MAKGKQGEEVLARNRAASHEFHLLHKFEAGIVLTGSEVKTARLGQVNLKDAHARLQQGELFLFSAHFNPYAQANRENHDPLRPRKLLLHAREIRKLAKQIEPAGMALVPTQLYLKNGRIKVELALARGKKLYDKREAIRGKEMDREMARAKGSRVLR